MQDKIVKAFTGSEVQVATLKGILDEAGIAVMIEDSFNAGITAGFTGGVPSAIDLFILDKDLVKAEPILKEFMEANR